MSILLRTTLNTDLPVERNENGVPVVEIVTLRDIEILIDYYNNGNVTDDIIEAFDRLIVEPRRSNISGLKYYWIDKICPIPLRDNKILTTYNPVVVHDNISQAVRYNSINRIDDIIKPVRRFQHYGILLKELKKPEIYTLIPIDENGPRGKVTIKYTNIIPRDGQQCNILDEICYNAYDTLKKYEKTYKYMLVISDTPKLYSYIIYVKNYVLTTH